MITARVYTDILGLDPKGPPGWRGDLVCKVADVSHSPDTIIMYMMYMLPHQAVMLALTI